MKTEDIEKLLFKTKNNFAPDNFDNLKNIEIEPLKKKVKIRDSEKSSAKSFSLKFACAALSLILIFTLIYNYSFNAEYERVYLDLNPSVEFVVNKYDKVIDYNFLNNDAQELYSDVAIKKENIEDLIEVFVEKAQEQGYFSEEENEITLSIYSEKNDTESRLLKLQEKLNSCITKNNINCKVVSGRVTKEYRDEAQALNISPAKYALIQKIISISDDYTLQNLKGKSIKELKTLYTSLSDNVSDTNGGGSDGGLGNGNTNNDLGNGNSDSGGKQNGK